MLDTLTGTAVAATQSAVTTAAPYTADSSEVAKTTAGSGVPFLQFLAFLSLVFLFVFMYFFAKKKRGIFPIKNRVIKEIERYYFNPKFFITVVKIDEDIFVLAVNENSTTVINKIDNVEEFEKYTTSVETGNSSFKDILNNTNKSFDDLKNKLIKMRHGKNED